MSLSLDLEALPVATHTPDGKVQLDQTQLGLLGCGAHGVVRLGRVLETGANVAVKVSPTSHALHSSLKELTVLSVLTPHPHVVRVHSAQVNVVDGTLYLVLDLCPGGELFDRIAEMGGMSEGEAKVYFAQILSAIAHCHEHSVFHRDLKPENILLDEDDQVRVADFGLASTRGREAGGLDFLRTTRCGSVSYAAPEIHDAANSAAGCPGAADCPQEGYDPEKADIWSLGIVLYCMLTASLPFEVARSDMCERYAAVLREGLGVMLPEELSKDAAHLLGAMLDPNPTARPSARDLLSHPWLDGVVVPGAPPPQAPRVPELAAPTKWSEVLTYETVDVGGASAVREPRLGKKRARSDPTAAPMRPADTWDLLSAELPGESSAPTLGSVDTARSGELSEAEALGEVTPPVRPSRSVPKRARQGAADAGDPTISDLVRHLGWERLSGSAMDLMASIVESLDKLGVEYVVDRQTRMVRVPRVAPLDLAGTGASGAGSGDELETRQAEVTIQLVPRDDRTGEELHDLNLVRRSGCTIAFHSLYRAFRSEMGERNGWSDAKGTYEVAGTKPPI